jgi:hypothetical protein
MNIMITGIIKDQPITEIRVTGLIPNPKTAIKKYIAVGFRTQHSNNCNLSAYDTGLMPSLK